MAKTLPARGGIVSMLVLLMLLTRSHHFGALPDASWAVFFLAGLSRDRGWLWLILMLESVAIDYAVIHSMKLSFWQHYCVSAAYWCLIPAYASLWLGGRWLAEHLAASRGKLLLRGGLALLLSEAVCYLISNGSFYWLSRSVPQPRSLAGWAQNLADWYLPFLGGTLLYVMLAAVAWLGLPLLVRNGNVASRGH